MSASRLHQCRHALDCLKHEFADASANVVPVFHQRFSGSMKCCLTQDSWKDFLFANRHSFATSTDKWQMPIVRSGGGIDLLFGKGSREGIGSFRRLAETGISILENVVASADGSSAIAENVAELIEFTPPHERYLLWLDLLHLTGQECRSLLLCSERSNWRYTGLGESAEEIASQMSEATAFGMSAFPLRPFVDSLRHDIFVSSVNALETWLVSGAVAQIGVWPDHPPICFPPTSAMSVGDERSDIAEQPGAGQRAAVSSCPDPDFHFDGATWHLGFRHEHGTFTIPMKGFPLLKVLIAHPKKHLGVLDLEAMAGLGRAFTEEGGQKRTEDMIDHKGLRELHIRIDALKREIEDTVNPERIAELEQQVVTLYSHKDKVTDKRGRPRPMGLATELERGRVRVRNSIDRTIETIGRSMPQLAKYLTVTVEGVGTSFLYDPSLCPSEK